MCIQFRRGEWCTLVTVVPRLPTNLWFPAHPFFARLTAGLHDVARGRLRGITGVLLGLGQRSLQRSYQRFQGGHARFQFRAPRTTIFRFAFRHHGG